MEFIFDLFLMTVKWLVPVVTYITVVPLTASRMKNVLKI